MNELKVAGLCFGIAALLWRREPRAAQRRALPVQEERTPTPPPPWKVGRMRRRDTELDDLDPGDYCQRGDDWVYCDPEGNYGRIPPGANKVVRSGKGITVEGVLQANPFACFYFLEGSVWELVPYFEG